MTNFSGKIALVTGAASGIGKAIATRFVNDGATVFGVDLNGNGLAAVAEELGANFIAIQGDAGKVDEIKSAVDQVRDKFGRLDILVNNAGIGILKVPEDVVEDEYDLQMNVLIKGQVFFVKYAADMLRAADDGCVVNISSAASVVSMPDYTPYGFAKAAVDKFTVDSTIQVPGIRHNSIQPGVINTPILEAAYGEEAQGLLEAAAVLGPVKRYGEPADIANTVAFLCSEQATFINGANIPVDGGIQHVSALAMEKVLEDT